MKTERVQKVTVSIPADVYAWEEAEREKRDLSRSEFVTEMLRERMYQVELEQRARDYEAAYRKQPFTEEEDAWVEHSRRMLGKIWAEEDDAGEQSGASRDER